jgi:hypothetical protein
MAIAPLHHLVLGKADGLPHGDEQLLPDDIDAGDHFGDRVLHLDAGVHFQEIKRAVRGHQEFHRAGAEIAGGPGHAQRGVADFGGQGRLQTGRRNFDELLMPPLDGAIAGAQVHHRAKVVCQDLHFHVLGPVNAFFQVNVAVAEGNLGLGAGHPEAGQQLLVGHHLAYAPAAAAGNRFDHQGIAVLAGEGQGFLFSLLFRGQDAAGGDHRDAGFLGDVPGDDLAAHVADDLRGRPDKDDAGLGAGLGKLAFSERKPYPGWMAWAPVFWRPG